MKVNTETTTPERTITLRPVVAADEAFLRELYASTRSDEMAMVPWTEEQRHAFIEMQFQAQQAHYEEYFPQATRDIVMENDQPVGRLYVDRPDGEINIIDLTLSPAERNRGIGSYLLKAILDEAARSERVAGIYVESFNPSMRFFKRLGFVETEESGIHIHLQWFPPGIAHKNASEPDGLPG